MNVFARWSGAGRRRFKRAEGEINAIVSPFCNILGTIGSSAMIRTGCLSLDDSFEVKYIHCVGNEEFGVHSIRTIYRVFRKGASETVIIRTCPNSYSHTPIEIVHSLRDSAYLWSRPA